GGDCQRDAHRDVGVLAFGHVHVPEHAPDQSCEQCDPGNLPVVDKESCDVTIVIGVLSFHCRTSTRWPSLSRLAPLVMMRSPACSPLTTLISVPLTAPMSTLWRLATSPALEFETTNTPYFPSFACTTAESGTSNADVRLAPSAFANCKEPIIPTFSK